MDNKKFFIVQSVICILAVWMLVFAAVGIYSDGKARKAEDPTAYIYTRESAARAAAPGACLLLVGLGFSIAGWVLGIRDEGADKPVMDVECAPSLTRLRGDQAAREEEIQLETAIQHKFGKIRLILLAVAIISIIAGIANGNMHAILVKAINICTECIGLG